MAQSPESRAGNQTHHSQAIRKKFSQFLTHSFPKEDVSDIEPDWIPPSPLVTAGTIVGGVAGYSLLSNMDSSVATIAGGFAGIGIGGVIGECIDRKLHPHRIEPQELPKDYNNRPLIRKVFTIFTIGGGISGLVMGGLTNDNPTGAIVGMLTGGAAGRIIDVFVNAKAIKRS